MKRLISFIIAVMMLVIIPIKAYALHSFIVTEPEIWDYEEFGFTDGPEIESNEFIAYYRYLPDVYNNCFYLRIIYNALELQDGENDIKVHFNITNNNATHELIISEDGFSGAYESDFEVLSNFGAASSEGQYIYIGVEFKNKNNKNTDNYLDFSVEVNGTIYPISQSLLFSLNEEATTQATTYRELQTENPTKNKSQKPSKNNSSKAESDTDVKNADEQNISTENRSPDDVSEEKLTPAVKSLIAVSVIVVISCIAVLVYFLIRQKKKSSDDNTDGPTDTPTEENKDEPTDESTENTD